MSKKLPNGNSVLEDFKIFSDVDFIVSDIDGTLTIGAVPVLEQIKDKISTLRRKHVFTTVATGRTYVGADKPLLDLGIEVGMPILLYNGGLLIEHKTDNVLWKKTIPYEKAREIVSIVDKSGAGIYIYTFDLRVNEFYDILESNHIHERVFYSGDREVKFDVNGTIVKPLNMQTLVDKQILSILVERKELTPNVYDELMSFLKIDDDISYTDSGSGFVEIKAVENRKDIIIDQLRTPDMRKKFKIRKILAIGDNNNDIDLFESADISVAVANASSEAIKKADYVCENENARGFLDMLYVLERAKYYYKEV